MDWKWQVAMISMRLKKFYKKTGRKLVFDAKQPVGFDKTKVECFNCHKTGHFARECRSKGNQDIRRKDTENIGYKARDNGTRPANQAESNALVVVDGDGIDCLSHLIRDCDFHEKRMAKKVELTKKNGKGTSQGDDRPVLNNVQRLNHKNKFVPTAVLTRTGRFPINTARQVSTAGPRMNVTRPRNSSYKSQSRIRRPLNRTTSPKTNFLNHSVNTVRVNTVSAVGGNRETAVMATAGCNWRSKRHYWSKDDPHKALKDKGVVDSGCSRHMTGNKAYLVEYQEFNGGSIAFGVSKGMLALAVGPVMNVTAQETLLICLNHESEGPLIHTSLKRQRKLLIVDVFAHDWEQASLDEYQEFNGGCFFWTVERYETTTPEGIDLILWGHLRTLFETNEDDELWKNQEDWILKSWTFYENCGVHILLLEDDTEIPMLAEKRYPLAKETLKRMLVLGLTVESVSDVALDLIRIVMKQIEEM
ncbi:ribonuclease H-like domain-containing protein [Tanacetum coccineum]